MHAIWKLCCKVFNASVAIDAFLNWTKPYPIDSIFPGFLTSFFLATEASCTAPRPPRAFSKNSLRESSEVLKFKFFTNRVAFSSTLVSSVDSGFSTFRCSVVRGSCKAQGVSSVWNLRYYVVGYLPPSNIQFLCYCYIKIVYNSALEIIILKKYFSLFFNCPFSLVAKLV